jgi:16S rRNA processing protein RimM
MKIADTEYVVAGKLGSTYGIQGWLKLCSFTELPASILQYKNWYIQEDNDWQLIKLEASRVYSNKIIVKLAGLDNPEEARLLTGKKIAVLRSALPRLKNNEYYWRDLEGLTVINQNDVLLGKVSYILETGSNDVLVIKGDKECAIPYLSDVIHSIDLKNQVIRVNWEWL